MGLGVQESGRGDWGRCLDEMEIVISVAAKIAEYTVAPVLQKVKYVFSYQSNIHELKVEHKRLVEKREGVQLQVDEAERNLHKVAPAVASWLERVDMINKDVTGFFEDEVTVDLKCCKGWCPDLKTCYLLSQGAKEKSAAVTKLERDGNFDEVAYPAPPQKLGRTFAYGSKDLESRTRIMNEIVDAIREEEITIVGVYGMGGVGKTTMMKEVIKTVEKRNLFDEVVMAVVSQNPNITKIQDEMADRLCLNLDNRGEFGRAGRLRARLLERKSTLVVLDDLWGELDLEAIGIPAGIYCKILLTSRSKDVCKKMRSRGIFQISVLLDTESWDLFREMAGDAVDSLDLHDIAREVLGECGGLPLAIATIGKALGHKEKHIWEDVLEQLRKSTISSFTEMQESVFSRVELSYKYLSSEEAKSCLLLCCLFPEDFDIPITYLVSYGRSLRFYKGVDTLIKTRNRVLALVDKLISSCLLLESNRNDCVKMHDIVRATAISVASREKAFLVSCDSDMGQWPEEDTGQDWQAISLLFDQLPNHTCEWNYPKLKLLQMACINTSQTLPDNLFRGTKELKVLTLLGLSIQQAPSSLQFLLNLQTLRLEFCQLRDMSVIGTLKTLENLSLVGSELEELPEEIKLLKKLRSLDLRGCKGLRRIPPCVLSNLSLLEELYIGYSFDSWREYGSGRECNANLSELTALHSLRDLVIWIREPEILPKGLLSNKLMRFAIQLGHSPTWYSCTSQNNNILLGSPSESSKTKGLRRKGTEQPLTVRFPSSWHAWRPKSNVLTMEIDGEDLLTKNISVLLEKCEILDLDVRGLTNISYELDKAGFVRLKSLLIAGCGLEYVINPTEWKSNAPFPLLEWLTIRDMWSLKEICPYEKAVDLPETSQLPKNIRRHPFLGNLKVLEVCRCNKLTYVFSPSVAKGLVQLEELIVVGCEMLEEIISIQGRHDVVTAIEIKFPRLNYLELRGLSGLVAFCKAPNEAEFPNSNSFETEGTSKTSHEPILDKKAVYSFEFPSLIEVIIKACPKMVRFSYGQVRTPFLWVVINDEEKPLTEDLDGTIQHVFEASKTEALPSKPIEEGVAHGTTVGKFDIDAGDAKDILAAVEYVEDIYKSYKLVESESRPHDYMDSQPDLNKTEREILVDQLILLHDTRKLMPKTLYLTINILDRFLSVETVPGKKFRLVGMAAIHVACLHEESSPLRVLDLVSLGGDDCTRDDFNVMERNILLKLIYKITVPTPYVFLNRFIKASDSDKKLEHTAFYLAELGLMDYTFSVAYLPSMSAAASVYTARYLLGECPLWTEALQFHTNYSESQLRDCFEILLSKYSNAGEDELKAVYEKYSEAERGSVALVLPKETSVCGNLSTVEPPQNSEILLPKGDDNTSAEEGKVADYGNEIRMG